MRIADPSRPSGGQAHTTIDLPEQQGPGVGRQPSALEISDDFWRLILENNSPPGLHSVIEQASLLCRYVVANAIIQSREAFLLQLLRETHQICGLVACAARSAVPQAHFDRIRLPRIRACQYNEHTVCCRMNSFNVHLRQGIAILSIVCRAFLFHVMRIRRMRRRRLNLRAELGSRRPTRHLLLNHLDPVARHAGDLFL